MSVENTGNARPTKSYTEFLHQTNSYHFVVWRIEYVVPEKNEINVHIVVWSFTTI
jgi:hypothetical protein